MQPIGRVEHNPGALNLLPRTLLRPRDPHKLSSLLVTQLDPVPGGTRHRHITSPSSLELLQSFRRILPDACTRRRARLNNSRSAPDASGSCRYSRYPAPVALGAPRGNPVAVDIAARRPSHLDHVAGVASWTATPLCLVAVGFLLLRAIRATGFYWLDDYSHLLISKAAWHHASLILNVWGRPLMTLTYMPAVLGGQLAARITSLTLTCVTAGLCWAIARKRGWSAAPGAALLLLAQPLTVTLAYSALPETLFSFFLALALYFRAVERQGVAALIVSLLPLARVEGLVVVMIWAGWLLLRGRIRLIPLVAVGSATWAIIGALVNGDPLWIVHANPYGIFGSIYGAAGWRYLFLAFTAFGPIVTALILALSMSRRIYDMLPVAILLGMFAFYVLAWTLPAFNTLGSPVYLVSVSVPAALCASETVAALVEGRLTRYRFLVIPIVAAMLTSSRVSILAAVLAIVGASLAIQQLTSPRLLSLGTVVAVVGTIAIGLSQIDPLQLNGVPLLAYRAAAQLGTQAKHVEASTTPSFSYYADSPSAWLKPASAIPRLPAGALVIWDSDLGPSVYSATRLRQMGFQVLWRKSNAEGSLILFIRR